MEWKETKNQLSATFTFVDFAEAFAFMTEVAFHAERLNHHPDWSNSWNKVDIVLTTHDAGRVVTEKDHTLAAIITKVYHKFSQKE